MTQFFLFCAGICYVLGGTAAVYEGKPWLGVTLALYAVTCVTIFLAGRS